MADIANPVGFLFGSCRKCGMVFDEANFPIRMTCTHMFCQMCLMTTEVVQFRSFFDATFVCFECNKLCTMAGIRALSNELREKVVQLKKVCQEVNELRNKVQSLEHDDDEMKEEEKDDEDMIRCRDCRTSEYLDSAQVCDTCFGRRSEVFAEYAVQFRHVDFETVATCSYCAIKNHINNGHRVSVLLPIVKHLRLESSSFETTRKIGTHRTEKYNLTDRLHQILGILEEGGEQLDQMMDMTRRGKTKDIQQELYVSLEEQIGSNIRQMRRFGDIAGKFYRKFADSLDQQTDRNKIDEAENCVSEVMPDIVEEPEDIEEPEQ